MRKMRQAHLWIGLIASVLILMESITGLLMNEPWLIGQTQMEDRGGFQQGQFPGQNQSRTSGQNQAIGQLPSSPSGQGQPTNSTDSNGSFQGFKGGRFGRDGGTSGSFMGIIKGLHAGRIGTTDVKWLVDLTAVAMIFLTGSGIFLSLKVLAAGRKKKKRNAEKLTAAEA